MGIAEIALVLLAPPLLELFLLMPLLLLLLAAVAVVVVAVDDAGVEDVVATLIIGDRAALLTPILADALPAYPTTTLFSVPG